MQLIVYDLKFVGPLEFELVAPMPEQHVFLFIFPIGITCDFETFNMCLLTHFREMHCCGSSLFWDGCNETQILGPQIVDYKPQLGRDKARKI